MLTGYSMEELQGKPFGEVAALRSDDLPHFIDYFQSVLAGREVDEFELQITRRDGSLRWISATHAVIKSSQEVSEIMAFARDITERKEAEAKLKESEARFREIFNHVSDTIFYMDLSGFYMDLSGAIANINERVSDLLGYSPDEMLGRGFDELGVFGPEDLARLAEIFVDSADAPDRPSDSLEVKAQHKDHRSIPVEITTTVVTDETGQVSGFLGTIRDVTERTEAEQALQQSEERFRTLIESASDAIAIVEPTGVARYLSPAVQRIIGYDPEELSRMSVLDLIHPEDQERIVNIFTPPFSNTPDARINTELRMRHKDGSWRTVQLFVHNLVDNPTIHGIVANYRDVTEQREAEQALRASQGRFRALIENSSVGILILSAEGNIYYQSPSFMQITGYAHNENLGRSFPQFLHPDDLTMAAGIFQNILANPGATATGQVRVRYKDGSWRWVEGTAKNLLSDPHVGGLVCNFRDITERKQAERKLQQQHEEIQSYSCELIKANSELMNTHQQLLLSNEALKGSEERFRTLIEKATDGIAIVNSEGIIGYESPSAEHILGYTPEEMVGMNLMDLIHAEDLSSITEGLAFITDNPDQVSLIGARYRRKDGSWCRVEGVARNLLADSKVQGIVINYRDISERKQAEESLKRYATETARSNAELEQFLCAASHDLREPLRTVQSYVQFLAKRYETALDADAKEFINYAVQGVGRMDALIQSLLAYSSISASVRKFESVDLEAVLNRTLTKLSRAIEGSEGVVTCDPLPTVMGDRVQLRQLLHHLLSNAIKFRGDQPLRVHIGAEQKEEEYVLSVKDNGIGFDQEYSDRIFGVFKRLHPSDEYAGTGMGLTLCRKIVERHGGRIWAESAAGQGATIYFAIKRAGSQER
jgi:PAS domain S-box-containing protein